MVLDPWQQQIHTMGSFSMAGILKVASWGVDMIIVKVQKERKFGDRIRSFSIEIGLKHFASS